MVSAKMYCRVQVGAGASQGMRQTAEGCGRQGRQRRAKQALGWPSSRAPTLSLTVPPGPAAQRTSLMRDGIVACTRGSGRGQAADEATACKMRASRRQAAAVAAAAHHAQGAGLGVLLGRAAVAGAIGAQQAGGTGGSGLLRAGASLTGAGSGRGAGKGHQHCDPCPRSLHGRRSWREGSGRALRALGAAPLTRPGTDQGGDHPVGKASLAKRNKASWSLMRAAHLCAAETIGASKHCKSLSGRQTLFTNACLAQPTPPPHRATRQQLPAPCSFGSMQALRLAARRAACEALLECSTSGRQPGALAQACRAFSAAAAELAPGGEP